MGTIYSITLIHRVLLFKATLCLPLISIRKKKLIPSFPLLLLYIPLLFLTVSDSKKTVIWKMWMLYVEIRETAGHQGRGFEGQ